MAARKTVTLFLYIPETKEVILARRGKLEKHPGLLQATVHGQIEAGEISHIAMKREFEEELKGDFHKITKVVDLGEAEVGDTYPEHTYYHAGVLPQEFVESLQTTQEVSEIIRITEDHVNDIHPYSKIKGTEDYDYYANMVMFDDEIAVLKKVFSAFA